MSLKRDSLTINNRCIFLIFLQEYGKEYIYKNKQSDERKGQFFAAQNPEILEKFEATHEYIKKLYEHSKGKLIFNFNINFFESSEQL